MIHKLKISITRQPQTEVIVRCRTVTFREKLLSKLFGDKQKLMILIPGDSVEELSIKEIDAEGGAEYDQ